jgi:sec-independent protein translocase protein TatB
MLDLSFGHIVVVFLVALVVLGPERLPGAARALGRWTGKARAYMRNFTAELERETQVVDLRKQLDDARRILREQDEHLHSVGRDVTAEARAITQLATSSVKSEATEPAVPHSPAEAAPQMPPPAAHD